MNKLLLKPQMVIKENGSYLLDGDVSSVVISVLPSVCCTLLFEGDNRCQDFELHLAENSTVLYQSFCKNVSCNMKIFLEGYESKIELIYSMISEVSSFVHTDIFHSSSRTSSAVYHSIVNYGKDLCSIQVDAHVPKKVVGCHLKQDNKIILIQDGKGKILPNLWIDEFDCFAEHSAYVSKFSPNERFYLMSRGVSNDQVDFLLTKAFLLGKFQVDAAYLAKFTEKIQNMRR